MLKQLYKAELSRTQETPRTELPQIYAFLRIITGSLDISAKPINPKRQAKSRQFLSVDTLIFVYYYSRLLVQREISRRHAGKCKAINGGGSGVCLFDSLCVIFVV